MSSTNISMLPELPLLHIFDKIPLCELLNIDKVCQAWGGKLKTTVLARRQELIILHGNCAVDELGLSEFNPSSLIMQNNKIQSRLSTANASCHTLTIKEPFAQVAAKKIAELMPNVKVLRVIQARNSTTIQQWLQFLLNKYGKQLVVFTIHYHYDSSTLHSKELLEKAQTTNNRLFSSFLQSLSALEHIEWTCRFASSLQLRELVDIPELVSSGTNNSSPYLSLEFANKKGTMLTEYIDENGHLKATFCWNDYFQKLSDKTVSITRNNSMHQSMVYSRENDLKEKQLGILKSLIEKHHSLLKLKLSLPDCTVQQLLKQLSSTQSKVFQSLTHLTMTGAQIDKLQQYSKEDTSPVMQQVKSLNLYDINLSSHTDFELMNLSTVFPSVQVLILRQVYTTCQKCPLIRWLTPADVDDLDQRRFLIRAINECVSKSRLHFTEMQHLQKANIEYWIDSDSLAFLWGLKRKNNFTRDTFGQATFLP